jgi:hypothetical protein
MVVDLKMPGLLFEERENPFQADLSLNTANLNVSYEKIVVPVILDFSWTGERWVAITDPAVRGFTAFLDKDGKETKIDSEVVQLTFATEGCVMAAPISVTPTMLEEKRNSPIKVVNEDEAKAAEMSRLIEEETKVLIDDNASPELKNKAVVRLGQAKDPSSVPLLLDLLDRSPDGVIKQNTIRALENIGDRRAAPALIAILEKPVTGNVGDEGEWEAINRRGSVLALGRIGAPAALPGLRRILDATPEDPSVREFATIAIRRIEGE